MKGEVMKKADLVKRTFWIRRDQDETLKEIAEREERSIAVLLRKAIDKFIEERNQ